jgi:hypothetical protein
MLASLIAGFASGETLMAVRRARRAAVAYVLALVALLCSLGFLIGAGYIWASRHLGPIEAALVFAGGFFVLALVVLLIHRLTGEVRSRRIAAKRKSDLTAVGVTAALAILPTLFRGKAGLATVAGPAIAMLAYAIYRENRRRGPPDPDAL